MAGTWPAISTMACKLSVFMVCRRAEGSGLDGACAEISPQVAKTIRTGNVFGTIAVLGSKPEVLYLPTIW